MELVCLLFSSIRVLMAIGAVLVASEHKNRRTECPHTLGRLLGLLRAIIDFAEPRLSPHRSIR